MNFIEFESWGRTHCCYFEMDKYVATDELSLYLYEVDECGYSEPYASLTKCLNYDDTKAIVKGNVYIDTNNFPEAIRIIDKYKLGKPTGKVKTSGFCVYPEYKMDIDEVKKYSINGFGFEF